MKIKRLIFVLLFLYGCAGSVAWQSIKMSETSRIAQANNQKMMDLKIGQSKPDVVTIMGSAEKREAYRLANDKNIEFLFYRTSGWSANDVGDKDIHFTPVAFENEKLVGWGRNYYDNVVRSAIDVTVK